MSYYVDTDGATLSDIEALIDVLTSYDDMESAVLGHLESLCKANGGTVDYCGTCRVCKEALQ